MKADGVKRLEELEREHARLKQIVADNEFENLVPREAAKGAVGGAGQVLTAPPALHAARTP